MISIFIHCFDTKLKKELLEKGFQLLKDTDEVSIFIFKDSIKFNFNEVDKTKFIFSNKLTF